MYCTKIYTMATLRQQLLRLLYPLIRKMGRSGKNGTVLHNTEAVAPLASFYDLEITLDNGKRLSFSDFSGKNVLLVNSASDCGYTGQYSELQQLHEQMGDQLVIIAFPSNDFGEQEQADDKDIARFCQVNYGVTFPVAPKGAVAKGSAQQHVFQWLSDPSKNGWNDRAPDWNFSKYVIDEEGRLMHYFGPSISPLEDALLAAVSAK